MSTRIRRIGSRTAHQEPDLSEPDEFAEDAPKPRQSDPARIAAGRMLAHALEAAGTTAEEVGQDGAVCLIVVSAACWTDVVQGEWRSWMRGGASYQDGGRGGYFSGGTWAAWSADEQPRPSLRSDEADTFAEAVSKGRHCAGFAADTAWLPPDLVHAADHRLSLPTLTGADVGAIARELCGQEATEALPDEHAAYLTPRLLRLARRLDQTADAYVVKLRDLLDRELAVPPSGPTGSPREEPTLDRLHGIDEAVAWGLAVATDLQAYREGRLSWSDVDRGCLLSGPPGCGKTLFAKGLAATCGVPLITGSYGQWHGTGSAHQGDLLKAMRKTFAEARSSAPSILFLDEVDSFPNRGTITHHYAEWEIQVVNALLAEIDGVESREGVVLVAACNHPDKLDPALVRSGRLDRHIRIGLPDRPALALILREHLGADLAGQDLSGATLAAAGSSGADCERLVRGARRRARTAEREMVIADLLEEIGGADERSDDDLWVSAVHEAGHAVVATALRPGSLERVSLIGSLGVGGATSTDMGSSVFLRAPDIRDRLTMMLAGRAAEEELVGVPSSGAGGVAASDLAHATGLAALADSALGLDETGGLIWRGAPEIHRLPDTLAADPELAERIRLRLDEAYAAARELLRPRLAAVRALAIALVDRRVLDDPEAEAIVRRHSGDGGDRP